MKHKDILERHNWCMENLWWYPSKYREIVSDKRRGNPVFDPYVLMRHYKYDFEYQASRSEQLYEKKLRKIKRLEKQIKTLQKESELDKGNYLRASKTVEDLEQHLETLIQSAWEMDLEENT